MALEDPLGFLPVAEVPNEQEGGVVVFGSREKLGGLSSEAS